MTQPRIQRNDPFPGTLPQPKDMLADACTGGAAAVNQSADIGSLEVGKKADLLVLDTFQPHLSPSGRILSACVHNGQPSDIESVIYTLKLEVETIRKYRRTHFSFRDRSIFFMIRTFKTRTGGNETGNVLSHFMQLFCVDVTE